ncbi:MAG: membrane protein insertase YidC [Gammaproteobacteria bacterium]
MLDRKMILYILLACLGFALWSNWLKEHPKTPSEVTANQPSSSGNVPIITSQQAQPPATLPAPINRTIQVRTNVLNMTIDTLGGNIVQANLLRYPENLINPHQAVQLLNQGANTFYVAESGLVSPQQPQTPLQFTAAQTSYRLIPGENKLTVSLTWQNNQGLTINKNFVFYKGQYAVDVNYVITNHSSKPWQGNFFSQLRRKPQPSGNLFVFHTFTGGAISSPDQLYQKFTFEKLTEKPLDKTITGGWLAMQQRYFISVWIPNQHENNHYYSSTDNNGIVTLGLTMPALVAQPGQQVAIGARFYVGPEITDYLKPLARGLDLTIDYGWLWFFSIAIFWLMKHIYQIVGNWGWAIVIVTILIKLLFYKLSEMSYRSMAKMRKLQPQMVAIRERYADDRQKMSQSVFELYRKEKVNPLGGCLPILIQIPVFIALYYVLIESVELRQAPFILWIHDLSTKDPFYILPLLMGLSMYVQQKLNPEPPDPTQAKILMFMPVIFTVFFMAFPSGLVLYWLTNNCLSILQQWYIMRRVEAEGKISKSQGKLRK